ncbi:uroporphyrinogen decarboxylase family protein [Bacteroides sp.]|uniref:uroporphyrinogen decarboxylase family protein n=1 Tax=Bacteroides sp. TaxID=29523 RepID=UPI00261CF6CB|nr:uroporphyrinogen decarboxylase family protein [Bacteroides sp.]
MINMKEWASGIIANPKRIAIPIMTHPGIELCGYTVKQAVTSGEIHAEAIRRLNEVYPAAACTVIMDLTVEAEAFGAEVVFTDNEVPNVVGRLVSDWASIEALEVPSIEAGRVPEYLKANRLAAEDITDKPIFGGCIGPFSLAGRLFDMSEMMMALYMEPDMMRLLLEKCTAFILRYLRAMKETGVNGVIIAEPAAGLVSNEDCSAFSSFYISKIVEELQDEHFMIILHNCGNTGHCTAAMVETKAAGLHFGNKIDMVAAVKECPADMLAMGNIDPVGIFKQASAGKVKEETLALLRNTAKFSNFVLSSGCDVPPEVPMQNIVAFYEALQEYNLSCK